MPKKKSPSLATKKVTEAKLKELVAAQMAVFTADAKARYEKARRGYVKQSDDTQDALDRMTALLVRIARKHMWVSVGKREDRVVIQIPEETIYHNMFYMASEILKDLATFDVRVADYTFPADVCVECGKEIKPTKKKKKVKPK